jgi:hypothetical protein
VGTQMELAESAAQPTLSEKESLLTNLLGRLRTLPKWTPDHDQLFAEVLDWHYEKVGPQVLTAWVRNCVSKYNDPFTALTPAAFDTFRPEIRRCDDGLECGLCHDTKWLPADDQNRMRRCSCPPSARIKYQGYREAPIDITTQIRKHRAAVDLQTAPDNPDRSLGFYLVECSDGNWELRSDNFENGYRRANAFEVLLWRALQFWKRSHFNRTGGPGQPIGSAPQVIAGDAR